jgi:chromosome segregation ATPase
MDTAAKKRFVLETMCAQLCRRDAEIRKLNDKYGVVKEKYRRSKTRLRQLGNQCDALTGEIERNREMLDQHMRAIREEEQAEIDDKLHHLEQLLRTQMDDQGQMLGEGQKPHVRVVTTRSSSVARERPIGSSSEFEFDSRTTEALNKYRTRSTKSSTGHSSSGRASAQKRPI